jgi:hypothetical protein
VSKQQESTDKQRSKINLKSNKCHHIKKNGNYLGLHTFKGSGKLTKPSCPELEAPCYDERTSLF